MLLKFLDLNSLILIKRSRWKKFEYKLQSREIPGLHVLLVCIKYKIGAFSTTRLERSPQQRCSLSYLWQLSFFGKHLHDLIISLRGEVFRLRVIYDHEFINKSIVHVKLATLNWNSHDIKCKDIKPVLNLLLLKLL
jgi:hypothetical protein